MLDKKRELRSVSITGLFLERSKQMSLIFPLYVFRLLREFRQIKNLCRLKASKKGKRALVLGNGPSLGYLSTDTLSNFQGWGNDVFSINHWASTHLADLSPNYLVISDGATLANSESGYGKMLTDSIKGKNALLETFLDERKQVRIFCPLSRVKQLTERFGYDRVLGFVDHEMRIVTSNIDPRFPRGYASLTLFKALAVAIHMGYDQIYLLGMDNTYPRDLFCDHQNRIHRLERHAGGVDTLWDQSAVCPSMAVWAQDLLDLFSDLHRCFSGNRVLNLDPYSLTDVFEKNASIDLLEVVLGNSV